MVKLLGKIIWKLFTYFFMTIIISLIVGAFFSSTASVIIFLIFILGSIMAIKDEVLSQDIPEYIKERKEKKLLNDSGKSFGMYRDVDMENMGFDSMLEGADEVIENMVYCTSCGNPIDSNSKFCSNCGAKIKKD